MKRADTHEAVIHSITNPEPELGSSEESVLLTENIQLRVPVQNTSGNELIEDTND